jgi:hypothetical protein
VLRRKLHSTFSTTQGIENTRAKISIPLFHAANVMKARRHRINFYITFLAVLNKLWESVHTMSVNPFEAVGGENMCTDFRIVLSETVSKKNYFERVIHFPKGNANEGWC